jgi:hypothetical protein
MNDRINYALKIGSLVGILGGLVFFIWSALNNTISYSISSGIIGFVVFTILGFILGILIYPLE